MSTNVYVIQAVIRTEDNPREDVLGVFTDKDESKEDCSWPRYKDKYAADLNDTTTIKTLLGVQGKELGLLLPLRTFDYDEVGGWWCTEKPLNEKDINLSDL